MIIRIDTAFLGRNKTFYTTWENFFSLNVIQNKAMEELKLFPHDRAFTVTVPYGRYFITKLSGDVGEN